MRRLRRLTAADLARLFSRQDGLARHQDVAVERLQLDARAAGPEREVEALAALARALPFGQLDGKVGGEIALERAHEHRRVGRAAQARRGYRRRASSGDTMPPSRIVPLNVTSPLTVEASRLEVCAFSMTMSPLVVSAVMSPDTLVRRMPSLTVVACTLPGGLVDGDRCLRPSARRSSPEPPTTRTLPCTVSTVTSAAVPSIVDSR